MYFGLIKEGGILANNKYAMDVTNGESFNEGSAQIHHFILCVHLLLTNNYK